MAIVKPLKLDGGVIKQMNPNDQLPDQPSIDDLYKLLSLMVLELTQMGIQFQNPDINNLLNNL